MINEFNRTFTEVAVMHILVFILIFVVGSIIAACDGLLYGLNDIFAYVGSIHKTYLLSVIKFVAATTSLLEAFVKSFQKKTEIFTKK